MKLAYIGLLLLATGVLTARLAGYKLYGSATVHDNRPVLDSPHELMSFAACNVVISSDGGRFEARGVTFASRLLDYPASDLPRLFNRRSEEPVLFQVDPASPSGLVFQRRIRYFCGNTFDPTFLPRRLPAYERADLGYFLDGEDLATTDYSSNSSVP
ncbi:MAG: hypothetical protein EOP86_11590 [Verrucomicrobiaceae bacterium]|nr:MAG: hypothetical protein EOP86_11590 [Verrucomicrobiaceae bacterium]